MSLPLHNVAIIYDYEYEFEPYKGDITSFLTNEFGTTPQTIEQQLNNNNRSDIVMDVEDNIMSFETPVVVYIRTVGVSRSYYNICTRARVSLTIIDVDTYQPNFTYNNVDVVKWKPDGCGHFTKYT